MSKIFRLLFAVMFLLVPLSVSCTAEHLPVPRVQVVLLDNQLEMFSQLWAKEVSRRYDNAVLVVAHGGNVVEGEWLIKSSSLGHPLIRATELVKQVQAAYPGRTIILISCNPFHEKLGIPGVVYSCDSCWLCPDREIESHREYQYLKLDGTKVDGDGNRSDVEPNIIGNVYELNAWG